MPNRVTSSTFRNAMARLGTAVNIVTTDGMAGRGGLTASAVCPVTDAPPTLLVCVNTASSQAGLFIRNKALCVNVLAVEHHELALKFAGSEPEMTARFAAGAWADGQTGVPVLTDAIASFECTVASILREGTHYVIFARVEAVRQRADGKLLVYADRTYHQLHLHTSIS